MEKLKEIMKDNAFIRRSVFILFNAVLLYILYVVISNIDAVSSALVSGFFTLVGAFQPPIIGLILAYLLNPLVSFIDNKLMMRLGNMPQDPIKAEKKRNRGHLISVLITYILVIAAVIAIIYGFLVMIVGHVVITDISSLADNVIAAVTNYEQSIKSWISNNIGSNIVSDKFTDFTGYLMTWLSDNVSATSVITFFTGIGGNVVDVVVGIIISIYIMKDKNFFLGLWRKFLHLTLPQKGNAVLTETLGEINIVLSKFIRGALLDSLFVAILASIGLSVLGLEAAVFIGVFAGIANIIPYFGPVLGMIPAFLMGIYTGGFWHGAIAVIILLVVQQIDSNIIYPKVVGTSTGLHPLMVLLAVSVFGYFGGILGMLLAVPTAGIIQIFVVKWANSREIKMKKQKEKNTAAISHDGAETSDTENIQDSAETEQSAGSSKN